MVSSARNAPSATVVIFGSAITVDASTPRPTRAPSSRSHVAVNWLEYSGNRPVRAMPISRSVAHTCQPALLCTGWKPSAMPMPSRRTPATTSAAYAARYASVAGPTTISAAPIVSAGDAVPATPAATIRSAGSAATAGSSPSSSAVTP
jgi:hypothetical protein